MHSLDVANFDFVVVGGGTAGSVLASRLSENPKCNILLLEAGRIYEPDGFPDLIVRSDNIGGDREHTWGFSTEPGFVAHSIHATSAKVLGGGSSVNAGAAMRAIPDDFKRWKEQGLAGWSFGDVLAFFKKLENTTYGDENWHGRNGPLPIRQHTSQTITPLQKAFVDSCAALGFPTSDDLNGPNSYGVAPIPVNIVGGVRQNTGMVYLDKAVRQRPNLRIRGRTIVDRLLIGSDNRITGVRLIGGEEIQAKGVILSAGAYGSASILMRSGIGPSDDLRKLGIPVQVDLPVGRNLMDHPFFRLTCEGNSKRIVQTSPVIGARLCCRLPGSPESSTDLHIAPSHFQQGEMSRGAVFHISVSLVRPTSVGTFGLRSKDPLTPPLIDLNFLSTPEDRRRMVEGVRLCRRILETSPLSEFVAGELFPGVAINDDQDIESAVVRSIDSYHHATCTAPMGSAGDRKAVVDSSGSVFGTVGLRVIDASIFPDVPSVETNITTVMVAEKIASEICEQVLW